MGSSSMWPSPGRVRQGAKYGSGGHGARHHGCNHRCGLASRSRWHPRPRRPAHPGEGLLLRVDPGLLFVAVAHADLNLLLSRSALVGALSTTTVALVAIVLFAFVWRRPAPDVVVGTLAASYINAGNLGRPWRSTSWVTPSQWCRRCCFSCSSSLRSRSRSWTRISLMYDRGLKVLYRGRSATRSSSRLSPD